MADQTSGYDAHLFAAEFYDHTVPYRERQDIRFYVDLARQAGAPVLEIGCGTGRVLLPIARAGAEIVGLDLSEAMLELCRAKLAAESVDVQRRVSLLSADMRTFQLNRTFPLVIIPFRPFQLLLTVEEQLECLDTIRRHTTVGGRFVLDVFNLSLQKVVEHAGGAEYGEEPPFTLHDGRRIVRSHRQARHDAANQIIESELIYRVTYPDGEEERLVHAIRMRYLFRYEAEHLLARSGFAVEAVYSDYDRSPWGAKQPCELIIVARRIE